MTGLTATAALLCTVLALVSGAAVLARTRSLAQALPVLLELLLAAGLLRLAHDPSWRAIASAAVIVALRKLVVAYGLRPAQRSAA
jgi:hypothetical protein